ncbi:MAG: preprotein translocase subunit SecA, partial [Acidobacteria bacterium]|nr:preprotein translocase subunit SecA [Acidobacteriota bacterium]
PASAPLWPLAVKAGSIPPELPSNPARATGVSRRLMINKLLGKVFGTANDRELKRIRPIVEAINAQEPRMRALTDDQLRGQTPEFRQRLANGMSLDELLPEAFAVCRETGRRVLGMRHFDVQLVGGIVLHGGSIAEMRTGEGKTLVATLPSYLNGLQKNVHVVTVNDYLARRDADWMGEIYRFLGLTVGCIQHEANLDQSKRREAYACDITYGTNNELGFDYLRDNMKLSGTEIVQCRGHQFAIVDEVDSILIDEARTPLIISGPSEGNVAIYDIVDRVIPRLKCGLVIAGEVERERREEAEASGDYVVDEKNRNAVFTEQGVRHAEEILNVGNLYDPKNIEYLHALGQALRAHALYRRDVEYLVEEGEVVIIDEHTGRKMPGRRWSDGLHQAIEAKEGVKVQSENQTLATITFQNYFRMYDKLSGMTGTAETEAAEFAKIYDLDVRVIPTNKPMIRSDHADIILRTENAKFDAVVEEIKQCHERRQPVLVGTISIEKSEKLSEMLRRQGVPHQVLNAKQHRREADIVAQAGRLGAVTIATNMAGRGTDILLGGSSQALSRQLHFERSGGKWDDAPEDVRAAVLEEAKAICAREHDEVIKLGGLHILGTERHEARRIDNQLRGRAGRQGDPGSSRFYLSLEDDLMRRFATGLMQMALKEADDMPIESGIVSRAIERAQKQVEAQNFEIRKRLLEYDDVQNKQRQVVYGLRREMLEGEGTREFVLGRADDFVEAYVDSYLRVESAGERAPEELRAQFLHVFGFDPVTEGIDLDGPPDGVREALTARVIERYEAKEARVSPDLMRRYERYVILRVLDNQWKDHLLSLDHLKEGIGLRAYAQKDPLIEYKKDAYTLFEEMTERIQEEIVRYLMLLEPMSEEERRAQEERQQRERERIFQAASAARAASMPKQHSRSGRRPRSAATTPVPADRARSTRSATE